MPKSHNLVIAVLVFVISVLILFQSNSIPDKVNLFPRVIAWALLILSVILFCQNLRNINLQKPINTEQTKNPPIITNVAVKIYLLSVICVILIKILGFFVSSVLFMLAVAIYLGGIKKRSVIIAMLIFNVFVYIVFILRLEVPIPSGIFF